jgi:regulator of replication initiation timing
MMKDATNDITELRRRVAKAKELSGGYDNRGNHVLGAFLTGILQEYDKVVNENMELKHQINELQLQVGDWKDAAEQTIAAARGTMIDAAGERQLRELVEERTELCKTVAFFASVIKSGESWSDTTIQLYTYRHENES